MTNSHYRQAGLARDHRFDGRFFVAVTTTGIGPWTTVMPGSNPILVCKKR